MGFDGLVFTRVCNQLKEELINGKLTKINQIADYEFLFTIYANKQNKQLLVSLSSGLAHLSLSSKKWEDLLYPSHFISLIRKHILDANIVGINQAGLDRILMINLEKRNEIQELVTKTLVIELTGKFTNLILVNEEGKIVDAVHRIPPLASTIRTIQPGAIYYPLPMEDKKDPFNDDYNPAYALTKTFFGITPLMEKEILYRINHLHEDFKAIMKRILNSDKIYRHTTTKGSDYHLIPFLHLNEEEKSYPLFIGLEAFYQNKIEEQKLVDRSRVIDKMLKREIKHNRNKLEKLNLELNEANNYAINRYYGDLLFTYGQDINKGEKEVCIYDLDTQKEVIISLNPLKDYVENANYYFTRYQKGQKAKTILTEQIKKTIKEITYLENIQFQLLNNDAKGILQIKEELIQWGYLKEETHIANKKKAKNNKYLPTEYTSPSGIKISVGKNNLQNEYLTFTLAKYNEIFMHVKDYSGSHVIIHAPQSDEQTLRMGANLAAYYSQAREASSVPVNYTLIKNVKKAKGSKIGEVVLLNYKTIYIDPIKM